MTDKETKRTLAEKIPYDETKLNQSLQCDGDRFEIAASRMNQQIAVVRAKIQSGEIKKDGYRTWQEVLAATGLESTEIAKALTHILEVPGHCGSLYIVKATHCCFAIGKVPSKWTELRTAMKAFCPAARELVGRVTQVPE